MKKENTIKEAPPSGGARQSEAAFVTGGAEAWVSENAADTSGGPDMLAQLLAENDQLKATIRLNSAHRQITGELAKAGARSPELLFEAVKGELKFTAEGELKNAKALIESVTARFPEQFGSELPGSIDAGAGTSGRTPLTRDVLAKMKPAEIAELDWAEVRRVLAAG